MEQKRNQIRRQALEYEKALPRKGKVFQMKCLPLSNGLATAGSEKIGAILKFVDFLKYFCVMIDYYRQWKK